MRAENIRVASKLLEKLKELECHIEYIETYFAVERSGKLDTEKPFPFEFNSRFTIRLTPSCFIADLKRQAEKLRFDIKALGVED